MYLVLHGAIQGQRKREYFGSQHEFGTKQTQENSCTEHWHLVKKQTNKKISYTIYIIKKKKKKKKELGEKMKKPLTNYLYHNYIHYLHIKHHGKHVII